MKTKLLNIVVELAKRIKEDDLSAWATKLTFFILLSIFPLLIFLIEILRQFEYANPEMILMLTEFFPKEISTLFEYIINDISNVSAPSTLLPITIVATLWSASKGTLSIIGALNVAYNKKETRSFLFIRFLSVMYTLAFIVILLISFTLIVLGRTLLNVLIGYFPSILEVAGLLTYGRYFLSVFFTYLFFIMLYNVSPNRKISLRDVTYGSIFATVSFVLLSSGFSVYVSKATTLSYMYGSLTSIIILLIWLYITSMIIMIGGELNAIILAHKDES